MRYTSNGTKETAESVALIAKQLLALKQRPLVLGLTGELGAGKTFFAQHFLRLLGVHEKVASPTFVLMKEYKLNKTNKYFNKAYHIDVYRLAKPGDLACLGFKEMLQEEDAIFLIEWAEKIKELLPANTIWLHFEHGKKENERIISYNL